MLVSAHRTRENSELCVALLEMGEIKDTNVAPSTDLGVQ